MRDVEKSREELLKEMERLRAYLEELGKSAGKIEETIPAPQESIEEYRLLFECSGVGALVIEEDMSISLVNKEFERLSGYTQDEIQREKNWTPLVLPESLERMKEYHRLRRIDAEKVPLSYETRVIAKGGRTIDILIIGRMIPGTRKTLLSFFDITQLKRAQKEVSRLAHRPATLNFVHDITQEKKLEAQFQTAQKMEAIGTLAGGIAHEFNNLLMGIEGHVSLLLFSLNPTHPHHESLKKIEEQVKSGANLASQLLAFARRGKYEVKPSDMNQILQRTSSMFERTKKEIRIHRQYQERVWTVEVDREQMEQVLLNLFVNAWQAMPDGGSLFLETRNTSIGPDYLKPFAVPPGKYVRIAVRDTGVGMDKKTVERVFEPFFTTREMGRGAGLGLASVYGIVKNHGGFITVYSEVGHGTTFHIYLPASEKGMEVDKKHSSVIPGGNETVLLVDDEQTIVEVMEKALFLTGYKVLVARGGEEAVEVFKKNHDRIDLVILDMIMPGMGGGKVFDLLRAIHPGVKVILSSGYSIDGEASQILARGCSGFIQKPFGIKELSQKIREVMERT
jgi:PAS domain S-box-containing protein